MRLLVGFRLVRICKPLLTRSKSETAGDDERLDMDIDSDKEDVLEEDDFLEKVPSRYADWCDADDFEKFRRHKDWND